MTMHRADVSGFFSLSVARAKTPGPTPATHASAVASEWTAELLADATFRDQAGPPTRPADSSFVDFDAVESVHAPHPMGLHR